MSNAIVEDEGKDVQEQWSTLQRVVLPSLDQLDTVPLYLDTGSATGVQLSTMNGDAKANNAGPMMSAPGKEAHAEDFLSRHSTSVRAGERGSFGTYFNAFPASYWRRWTNLETVRLTVRTTGTGAVSVYKSNARGALQHVETQRVSAPATSTFELSLKPFGDGGWYWFDLVAGSEPMALVNAGWLAPGEAKKPGSITLEITTLNKNEFCLNNLRILAENPEALDNVAEVLIVDQGTKKLVDAEGFDEAKAALGGKLRMPLKGQTSAPSAGIARLVVDPVGQPRCIEIPQDRIKALQIGVVGRKSVGTGHVGHNTAKAIITDGLHLQPLILDPFMDYGIDSVLARRILKCGFIDHITPPFFFQYSTGNSLNKWVLT